MNWLLIGLLATILTTSSGLRCYSCSNADSNAKCTQVKNCPGTDGCQNVVRMENGILRISKGCQQFSACRATSRQNYRQCSPTVQSVLSRNAIRETRNLPPSVCTSCCNTNLCNKQLFLQQEDPFAHRIKNYKPVLIPSRPSVRDLNVAQLTPDTALITFKDTRNHSVYFFKVQLVPKLCGKITPVILKRSTLKSLRRVSSTIPTGSLAFLIRNLGAGRQYRIAIVSKRTNAYYRQKIMQRFVTKPRRPRRIKVMRSFVKSLVVYVTMPRYRKCDRVTSYSMTYRKATDPPSAARRIPDFNRLIESRINNLQPATKYIITAWTNVKNEQGRLLASSAPINITAYTAVPGIAEVTLSKLHATSLTWRFRVPSFATRGSQQRFIVQVRDNTNGVVVADAVLPNSQRSFTVRNLTPQTAYSFSVKAQTNGRESRTAHSKPVFTLIRCYTCLGASSRDQCDQFVECPPDASGCLNEVRKRTFSHSSAASWYRASLVCKQVTACNTSEEQDATMQCNPDRNRHNNPPNVCRCCCEGDLCNGPGSACGHILGWLDPFRDPESAKPTPAIFCPDPNIEFATVSCSNENEIGSECTYACQGETYLVGKATITCTNRGSWNNPLPRCDPLPICTSIEPAEGVILECSRGFKAGSVCTVGCEEGYIRVGSEKVSCQNSGEWDEPLIPCLPEDDCQPNQCLNGATCHDRVKDFECECVEGWTGRLCDEEVFCELLQQPEHGHLECTDSNRYSSRCRYACDDGYEQHGATFARCLADGYWSSFEPTLCVVKTCPIPPQRLVNGGKTECTGFEIGDTCSFTCPNGLVVAGGPTNITCKENHRWTNNVPCCDLQCPPHAKVDLYVLLDSSSSIGKSNWILLKNFLTALLDQFAIGPDDMRVGVGRYNAQFDTRSEITLGNYINKKHLMFKINIMRYRGSGTRTGNALWHVQNVSLNHPNNRPGVSDVVLVITDGKAQDDVAPPSYAIKKGRKAKIYVVGVRNRYDSLNYTQLSTIASGPRYLRVINRGYQALARSLSKTLTRDVCWIPCKTQYEEREIFLRRRTVAARSGDREDERFWATVDAKRRRPVDPTPGVDGTGQRPTIPPEEPQQGGGQLEQVPTEIGTPKKTA